MERQAAGLGDPSKFAPAGLECRKAEYLRMREGTRFVGQCENAAEHLVRTDCVRDLLLAQDLECGRGLEDIERMDGHATAEESEQGGEADQQHDEDISQQTTKYFAQQRDPRRCGFRGEGAPACDGDVVDAGAAPRQVGFA